MNAFSPIALSLLTGLPTDSVSQAQEILSKVIIPMKVADVRFFLSYFILSSIFYVYLSLLILLLL